MNNLRMSFKAIAEVAGEIGDRRWSLAHALTIERRLMDKLLWIEYVTSCASPDFP